VCVVSTVKMSQSVCVQCLLCESHLTDVLTVNIDLMGDLVGLSVSTSVSHCSTTTTSLGSLANFNTSVELVQPITGPVLVHTQ
jgi:hypothetical protein